MIDVVSQTWLEVAERIVGESRKVQHSIKTCEIFDLYVSRVLADCRHRTDFPRKRAACVKIAVKPDHFVSRLNQHRRENCTYVAQVSCHQYPHCLAPFRSCDPSLTRRIAEISMTRTHNDSVTSSALHRENKMLSQRRYVNTAQKLSINGQSRRRCDFDFASCRFLSKCQ